MPRLNAPLLEIVTYGLATSIAFAVDLSLLTLLVTYGGVFYALAAAISFIVGGVVLYFLSVRFVFRFRRVANHKLELSYFVMLGVAGLMVQTVVMIAVDQRLHVSLPRSRSSARPAALSS